MEIDVQNTGKNGTQALGKLGFWKRFSTLDVVAIIHP